MRTNCVVLFALFVTLFVGCDRPQRGDENFRLLQEGGNILRCFDEDAHLESYMCGFRLPGYDDLFVMSFDIESEHVVQLKYGGTTVFNLRRRLFRDVMETWQFPETLPDVTVQVGTSRDFFTFIIYDENPVRECWEGEGSGYGGCITDAVQQQLGMLCTKSTDDVDEYWCNLHVEAGP